MFSVVSDWNSFRLIDLIVQKSWLISDESESHHCWLKKTATHFIRTLTKLLKNFLLALVENPPLRHVKNFRSNLRTFRNFSKNVLEYRNGAKLLSRWDLIQYFILVKWKVTVKGDFFRKQSLTTVWFSTRMVVILAF